MSDVSKFFEDMLNGASKLTPKAYKTILDDGKNDLRGAQFEQILGGVPYVGDFIRGIEGAETLEDLYNATGKIPAYPSLQNMGLGSIGSASSRAVTKVANGQHDLYEFYSGEPDAFRSAQNFAYQ